MQDILQLGIRTGWGSLLAEMVKCLPHAHFAAALLQIELDEEGREVELGKGAFGVVVRGRYRLSPVAVKRLINQTPEQQAQFLKEMAILRACRGSRYIVPFVGASLQPVRALLSPSALQKLSACPGSIIGGSCSPPPPHHTSYSREILTAFRYPCGFMKLFSL